MLCHERNYTAPACTSDEDGKEIEEKSGYLTRDLLIDRATPLGAL